jgi:hypothetical protein
MPAFPRYGAFAFALALAAVGPARAVAQGDVPFARLALLGGQLHYRVPEAHDDAMVAVRLAAPLVAAGQRHWLVEPGASYGWYESSDGTRRHVFVAELQVQFQAGSAAVQPYVGVGGGFALTQVDTTLHTKPTASASAGVRAGLTESLGVLGEVRFRRLEFFRDWTRELTVGLYASWR